MEETAEFRTSLEFDTLAPRSTARCPARPTDMLNDARVPLRGADLTDFESDFHETLEELRSAVLDCATEVLGPAPKASELARELRLDKNLAWKAIRLTAESEPGTAMRFVPGATGLRILVERFGERVEPLAIRRLQDAMERFENLQQRHAGDRASLELLALGLDTDSPPAELLETARRQAFLGTSAILGYQARQLLSLVLLAPGQDSDSVEQLQFASLLDFRRLRRSIRARVLTVDGAPTDSGRTPLVESLCSAGCPRLEIHEGTDQHHFEIGSGHVGNAARFDLCLAHRAPVPTDAAIEFEISTPCESLVLAVGVHRSLESRLHPRPVLRSVLGPSDEVGAPIPVEREFGDGLAGTGRIPGHDRSVLENLLEQGISTLGHPMDEFEVKALSLPFPPTPTVAELSLV